MSYFLPHLPSGWHVDEAIKSEEDRVVVIRFGHDWDSQCMTMDETLYSVAEKVQNFVLQPTEMLSRFLNYEFKYLHVYVLFLQSTGFPVTELRRR